MPQRERALQHHAVDLGKGKRSIIIDNYYGISGTNPQDQRENAKNLIQLFQVASSRGRVPTIITTDANVSLDDLAPHLKDSMDSGQW